jgi:hypothetical protein
MRFRTNLLLWPALAGLMILLAACGSSLPAIQPTAGAGATATPAAGQSPSAAVDDPAPTATDEYRLVTVLPRDAIAAIDDPQFYNVLGADLEYGDQELVMGVVFGREARAYSVDVLAQREIVNDTVAGQPIAVTY